MPNSYKESTMKNPKIKELKDRIRNIDSMLSPRDYRDSYSKSGKAALVKLRASCVQQLKNIGEEA